MGDVVDFSKYKKPPVARPPVIRILAIQMDCRLKPEQRDQVEALLSLRLGPVLEQIAQDCSLELGNLAGTGTYQFSPIQTARRAWED